MRWQLASPRVSHLREYPKQKPQFLCNLTLEVTSHYLSFILFTRTKSLNPAQARGGDYTKVWIPGNGDHCRVISDATDHSGLDQAWMASIASFACLADENLAGVGNLNWDGSSLFHHCSMKSLII